MSSVPMANGGSITELRILGCNEAKDPEQVQTEQNPSGLNASPLNEQSTQNQQSLSPVTTSDTCSSEDVGKVEKAPSKSPIQQTQVACHLRATANGVWLEAEDPTSEAEQQPGTYHRIREVREQQGVSVRSMARRIGIDVKTYKRIESSAGDLTLADLNAIQKALDVPLTDLLIDRQSLSRPVEERAKLVKAMKSAVAIREAKSTPRVERLGQMLCEQLVDLMPELKDVSGWPQFGARRGQSALGKALCQPIDMSHLTQD